MATDNHFLSHEGLQQYTELAKTYINTKIADASSIIVLKHDTEANWAQVEENFRPLDGEIILYDPDEKHPYLRYKRGRIAYDENGIASTMLLRDLPFESSVYIGTEKPEDAPIGFLWLDTSDSSELLNFMPVEGVEF